MFSNRERLLKFYHQFNPSKVGDVDKILEEFRGREDEMFEVLSQKYNSPVAPPLRVMPTPPTGSPTHAPQPRSHTTPGDSLRAFGDLMDATFCKQTSTDPHDILATVHTSLNEIMTKVCAALSTERAMFEEKRQELQRERTELYAALEVARSDLEARERRVENQEQQLSDLALSLKLAQETGVARLQCDLERFLSGNAELLKPQQMSPHRANRVSPYHITYPSAALSELHIAGTPQHCHDMNSAVWSHDKAVSAGVEIASIKSKLKPPRDSITTALRTAKLGDVVCLQPGVYMDNIIMDRTVEIRGTGSRKEDVIIEASDQSRAIIEVHAGTVTLSNLTLRQRHGGGGHCLSASGRSEVKLSNILLCDGNGGVVAGDESNCVVNECTVSRCSFAGLFARDSSYLVAESSKITECEVGIRVRDATFLARSCVITDTSSDGVVLHDGARGILEANTVQRSRGSGVVLSARSETILSQNLVCENQKWGVWCPAQVQCTLTDNDIRDNKIGNVTSGP